MTNGIPNVPQPPSPQNMVTMVMQDVNQAINLAIQPINLGMGWAGSVVTFITAIPGRAMSALRPGGM